MIFQNLIELIENNANEITKDLVEDFRKREETWHYRNLPQDVLYERIHEVIYNVYARLGNWLSKKQPKDVVFAHYTELGRERYKEGIPLQEVVMVLMRIKMKLWEYLIEHKTFDTGYGLNQLMEMSYFVNLFFDRIIHSTIVGYEEEAGHVK